MTKQEKIEYILNRLRGANPRQLKRLNYHSFKPFMLNLGFKEGELAAGECKGVIIPEELDFVYKIPFRYNSSAERIAAPNSPLGRKNDWNYCQKESELFFAIGLDFEDALPLFADVELLCRYGKTPIYIQEKCICFEDAAELTPRSIAIEKIRKSGASEELQSRIKSGQGLMDPEWMADAVEMFGCEALQAALDSIYYFAIDGDFHGQNYGYSDVDGRPVLIDYASYE